jgi:hypothetical protein
MKSTQTIFSSNRYMLLYESTSTDEDEEGVEIFLSAEDASCDQPARRAKVDLPHLPSPPLAPLSESKYEDYVKRQEEDDEETSSSMLYRMVPPVILTGVDVSPFFQASDLARVHPNRSLQITDKGLYSITKPADVLWTNTLIQRVFQDRFPKQEMKEYDMVDGTAGIGGNTISFASLFREVHAVEYNDVHYEVLRNNIREALALLNVMTYHENVIQWVDNQTINANKTLFFIDPPWGGRKYKLFKYFTLRLGRMFIQDFIQKLYRQGYPMVILKAPLNLNVNVILHEVGYHQVVIERGLHMMLLIFS